MMGRGWGVASIAPPVQVICPKLAICYTMFVRVHDGQMGKGTPQKFVAKMPHAMSNGQHDTVCCTMQ